MKYYIDSNVVNASTFKLVLTEAIRNDVRKELDDDIDYQNDEIEIRYPGSHDREWCLWHFKASEILQAVDPSSYNQLFDDSVTFYLLQTFDADHLSYQTSSGDIHHFFEIEYESDEEYTQNLNFSPQDMIDKIEDLKGEEADFILRKYLPELYDNGNEDFDEVEVD